LELLLDELLFEELLFDDDDEALVVVGFTSLPSALRRMTRDEGPQPTTNTNRVRSGRFMAVFPRTPREDVECGIFRG
jgi:hypothetical protein